MCNKTLYLTLGYVEMKSKKIQTLMVISLLLTISVFASLSNNSFNVNPQVPNVRTFVFNPNAESELVSLCFVG